MQVRILLCLGATNLSSNVNETHVEELEMLIKDLGKDRDGEQGDDSLLATECPFLAVSLAECMLQASLLVDTSH